MQLMKFLVMNLGCRVAFLLYYLIIWIKVKFITISLSWPSWCFFFILCCPHFYCWYYQRKLIFSPFFIMVARPGFDPGPGEVWSLCSLKLKQSLPAQINVSIADTFPYRKLRLTDALVLINRVSLLCYASACPFITPIYCWCNLVSCLISVV